VTLLELVVVLAALGSLAAAVYPSYRSQMQRARIGEGMNALADSRARMEQYFLNNRSYASGPCGTSETVGAFTLVCSTAPTATAYTITATGSALANGFVFTIDEKGTQRTTGVPSGWGTVPTGGYPCWIRRQGDSC
jgi:type IV pilus assembly protein PilE